MLVLLAAMKLLSENLVISAPANLWRALQNPNCVPFTTRLNFNRLSGFRRFGPQS